MWGLWWVWLSGAVVLGLIEIVVPGYVFFGFALGAAVTGIVLLVGGPVAAALAGSVPGLLLFFAVVSLLCWLGLRRWLGVRKGQIKIIDRDINED
ncbi:NfeD family protein [Palleronia sp. KMU-117]|uniref:NfeD family protein n=1 Tax=Palleronia sp. KMU-117 TaxID=3434108 RepID=UPI003D73BE4A